MMQLSGDPFLTLLHSIVEISRAYRCICLYAAKDDTILWLFSLY